MTTATTPPTTSGPPAPSATARANRVAQAVIGNLVVGVVTLAAVLAGVDRSPEAEPALASGATGGVTEVTVTVAGMAFVPNRIEVPAGNRLVITFENTGDQLHDLEFASGRRTHYLSPGSSETLDAGLITADVEGWCSLAGHKAMGMTLNIVARGADPAGAIDIAPAETPGAPTMAELIAKAEQSPALPAELPPLSDATHHEVTLTVTERTEELADGVSRAVWTYNGTSPGPTLHGRVGDTFSVTLVNDGTMGHSIDFHAGELAPDEPMRTIAPGETLTYQFTATRAGIWMYHCATMPMSHHIANGMFGAVVIEPAGLAPATSYVLVQSEMYLGADGAASSDAKVAAATPDVVVFNGRPFQYAAHPLKARTGEPVRVWVLDAGPNSALSFHVVGTQFDTVWTEGGYSISGSPGSGAQVLPLLAGQGGFVEFTAPQPGHYPFVNHQMSLAEKGAQGTFEVTD